MSNRPGFRFFLYLLTGFLTIAQSCRNGNSTSEEASAVKTPVTIVPVTFRSVSSTVDLPAVTMFMKKSIVRATTTGSIEKISVNPGDFITTGQMLFMIRTREAMALKSGSAGDTSLSFRGLININSNKDGVISSVSYQRGDFVVEGDELAVISDRNSLVFILDVPFELNGYIEKNRNCNIILPDKKQVRGTITGKLPEMDIQSQTIRYVVKPSDLISLPGNLIATIRLVKSTSDNAVVLPKPAILSNETQTEFWVMKLTDDSTAVKVVVTKGFENNEEVEITRPGFLASDRIVLTGNYGLSDTARISIIRK
jgi:multidrug efflux pump subunit AcrA (membrane-fusion protein)